MRSLLVNKLLQLRIDYPNFRHSPELERQDGNV